MYDEGSEPIKRIISSIEKTQVITERRNIIFHVSRPNFLASNDICTLNRMSARITIPVIKAR